MRRNNDLPKVKVNHLTKIFGKKTKPALEMIRANKSKTEILEKTGATVGVYDVNFEVEEGEIFVIMGLSGSGKSTLIRLLNRLIEPTSGNIYIDGQDISSLDKEELREVRRNKMSMVFQNFGLFPHRTILENTEYGLEIRGVPKEERQAKAEKALENSSLIAFKDQLPSQLSGGMQQRVGLARALANDPEILLMDEAFSALDPLIRREMQDELLDLQENVKKTIIFITHDLNEALRIGDRIALMKDGQIMQIGTGEEILTNPANEYVRTFVEDVDRSKVLTAQNIMVPVQLTMMSRLHKIFGQSWSESLGKSLTKELVVVSLGKSAVGNILKVIPVVGTVTGGMVNASVAVAITEALGWVTVKMLNDGVDIFDDVMSFKGQFSTLFKAIQNAKKK